MSFIKDLFKKLKVNETKPKKSFSYLKKNDPMLLWEVVSEIGDGAFGKVFKAQKRSESVIAALKQVILEEEGDLEEYMVEIEILTEFKHPNIVNLFDAYHFENKLWMALEFCNGGALDSLMMDLDKNLNEKGIKYVAKEVLLGLTFLHEHGVIHRDMKAGNILVTKEAEVKLADFGVSAKLTSDRQKRNTVQGTPYWMAPEVISCQNMETYYDIRADIWSFGITLIELAQMRPPYHQMQPNRVLLKIAKAEPPTLDFPNSWSSQFISFLSKCLTKNPNQRPYGTELLGDPFITSCTDDNKRALKILIYEAKAENIEEIVEELDLKNVRDSVAQSDVYDDISKTLYGENDNSSISSSDVLTLENSVDEKVDLKTGIKTEILNELIKDQISSEDDKISILGVVCDAMQEQNPRTNIDKTILELDKENSTLNRRDSLRMAMETVPIDIGESDFKEDTKESDRESSDGMIDEASAVANINRKKSYYKTMTKTRKFVVDGEEITTTTTKVVREGLENKKQADIQYRKEQLREMKILAKEEGRQNRQLTFKVEAEKTELLARQKNDESACDRNHELEMERLAREQKMKLEKMEYQNYCSIKALQKKLMADKTNKENDFRTKDKIATNKEIDKLSKSYSKENIKKLKENYNIEFQERLKQFQDNQDKEIELRLEDVSKKNRLKMGETENSLFAEKYNVIKKYNNEKSKLLLDHCQTCHQVEMQHNKDLFMLKRQQVKSRQEKELELLAKENKKELDELENIHQNERKMFPRMIKNVSKTRFNQKKGELTILLEKNILSATDMKKKLKEFTESEKEREKKDSKRMEEKLRKTRDEMTRIHFQTRRENEQIHDEQRRDLTNQEGKFMQELEHIHKEKVQELHKKSAERENEAEKKYKIELDKIKSFYNVDETSNGSIKAYSTESKKLAETV